MTPLTIEKKHIKQNSRVQIAKFQKEVFNEKLDYNDLKNR